MIRIIGREYRDTFDPLYQIDWLLGNVGDWKRARFLIECGVDYIASTSEPLAINVQEKTLKLMNGKKWSDYGFDLQGEVTVNYVKQVTDSSGNTTTTPVSFTFFIQQIYNDTIVYDSNSGFGVIGYEMIPTERATEKIYGVKLFKQSNQSGIKVKYNNISNSEVTGHDLHSFIDGCITEGYAQIGGQETYELTLIGNQSGMAVSRMTVSPGFSSGTPGVINANWNIPIVSASMQFNANSTNFINIAPLATRNSYSTPAQYMTKSVTGQSVPNTGASYGNGTQAACFLYNAQINELLYFSLDINLTAVNTTNETDPIFIRLVLIKYDGEGALNFAERIVLKEWQQEHAATNVPLQYSNITPIGVEPGTSYALTIEWSAGAIGSGNINRKLDYKINSGSYSLMQDLGGGGGYKSRYWVEVDYMLASFFEDLDSFRNLTPPATVFDANSLTDYIEIEIFPEWNNPNVSLKTNPIEVERLGNTGWFFENYNGLPNPFTVKDLKYTDLLDGQVEALSFGQEIKVRAVIGGYTNITPQTSVAYGFMWTPVNEEDYKVKPTPFHKNTKVNSPELAEFNVGTTTGGTLVYEGFTAVDGERMDVKNISISQVGNDLVFEAIFMPTQQFTDFMEARPGDRNYILWLSVGEGVVALANRVSLLLDFNEMQYFIPVSGELEGVVNRFIEHPEDETYPGVEVYEGFLEDDVLARSTFTLPVGTRLNQIVLGYEVENVATGYAYELERYSANLQQFITTPDGIQQLAFNGERGYKFVSGNNKNWAKVIRNPDSDANGQAGYEILFGQKIRWEYWLQRNNVPSEYYDSMQEFNGSNNDWLHFLRTAGHSINFFILFDVVDGDEIIRYKNTFPIDFDGYDENENIQTEHNYYDDATNALMNIGTDPETGRPLGVLLSNKNTRIEIIYTKLNGDWDLGNLYSVTTIEIDGGVGQLQHRQLSSVIGSESDNILIPLPGNDKLRVELIAPNQVKTTCVVDYTRLTPAQRYKITGRIGCFRNDNGIPIREWVYEQTAYSNEYE